RYSRPFLLSSRRRHTCSKRDWSSDVCSSDLGDDPAGPAELEQLHRARRIIAVRLAGTEHLAAVEDAGLLRDALGTALPPGIPDRSEERRVAKVGRDHWARVDKREYSREQQLR